MLGMEIRQKTTNTPDSAGTVDHLSDLAATGSGFSPVRSVEYFRRKMEICRSVKAVIHVMVVSGIVKPTILPRSLI